MSHQHEDEANCFDQLPQEITIEILSRLPITSLLQLSFTCRSLHSLSRHPSLVETHLSRSSNQTSPCLILHSDYPLKNQLHFLHLPGDKKIRKLDTPFLNSLPEYKIIGSCNGMLCLVNTLLPAESIYLYNPFTRDYKSLPPNPAFQNQIVLYGFGVIPFTNDYKVVKIGNRTSEVQTYSLRSNTWQNRGIVPYRLETNRCSQGVLVNGKLHWVSTLSRFASRELDRVIVSYDLSHDSFDVIMKPRSATRWVNCHLSALDSRLCTCVTGRTGYGAAHIWVMKEYGANESWVKAYEIRAYYPVSMVSDKLERFHHIWRNMFSGKKSIRVLCVVKESGGVLLEYVGGCLVLYDPCNGTFQDVSFPGMPGVYQTTLLVGSLQSPAASPA